MRPTFEAGKGDWRAWVTGRLGLAQRYLRFCVVGGSGVVVDMAVLWLLVSVAGWNLSVAKVLAAEAAIVNGGGWRGRSPRVPTTFGITFRTAFAHARRFG